MAPTLFGPHAANLVCNHPTEQAKTYISAMVCSIAVWKYIIHLGICYFSDNSDSSDSKQKQKHICKTLQQFLSAIRIIYDSVGDGFVPCRPLVAVLPELTLEIEFILEVLFE